MIGTYYCKQYQQNYENCLYRYMFLEAVSDDTGTTWVFIFDDQAKTLLDGITADQLHAIYNGEPGQTAYNGYFAKANITDWIFTCKVKQKMNQNESRVKTSMYSLHPVDYAKKSYCLLNSVLSMYQMQCFGRINEHILRSLIVEMGETRIMGDPHMA